MSWFRESKRSWLESFCIKVLKNGPIPHHIAFIMDGNRRYATMHGLQKVEGHPLGFEKLSQTLEWCLDLGITEVTVYTLSIENFKRPKEEVDFLINLAHEKFTQLLQEKDMLDKYEVKIRVLGDLTLLPVDLQKLAAEVVLYTRNNKKRFFNLCLAYTAREEIVSAVKDIANGVISEKLDLCDVTEELIDQCLYAADATKPDLLVRTSGEVRLSDFLLWQCSYSLISFIKVLWPEFNIWHLFLAVLYYQHHFKALKNLQCEHKIKKDKITEEEEERYTECSSSKNQEDYCTIDSDLQVKKEHDQQKATNFLQYIQEERLLLLQNMRDGCTKQNVPYVC